MNKVTKSIGAVVVSGMLSACGSGANNTPNNTDSSTPVTYNHAQVHMKILDWQTRERIVQDTLEEFVGGYTTMSEVEESVFNILQAYNNVKWMPDDKDYWKTSLEAATDMVGDCEDISAYWYRIIRDSQIVSDCCLSMRWLKLSNGNGHMVIAIQIDGEERLIDNGYLKSFIADAEIKYEFDLWSIFK